MSTHTNFWHLWIFYPTNLTNNYYIMRPVLQNLVPRKYFIKQLKQVSAWKDIKKCWTDSYSTREKTRNSKQYKTNIIKWNTTKDLLAAAANKNGKSRKTLSLKTMRHLGHAYQKIMTLSQIMFAELDIVMSMCNLLEYSDKYLVTSGSLWKCYRDEIDIEVYIVDNNDSKTKSFKYITKIIGKTPAQSSWPGNLGDTYQTAKSLVPSLNVEFTIALKYLKIFGELLIYLWLIVK